MPIMPIPPARKAPQKAAPEKAPAQTPLSGDLTTHSGIDAHGNLHTAVTQDLLLASIGAAEAVYAKGLA